MAMEAPGSFKPTMQQQESTSHPVAAQLRPSTILAMNTCAHGRKDTQQE